MKSRWQGDKKYARKPVWWSSHIVSSFLFLPFNVFFYRGSVGMWSEYSFASTFQLNTYIYVYSILWRSSKRAVFIEMCVVFCAYIATHQTIVEILYCSRTSNLFEIKMVIFSPCFEQSNTCVIHDDNSHEIYWNFSQLLQSVGFTDVLIVAYDLEAHISHVEEKRVFGDPFLPQPITWTTMIDSSRFVPTTECSWET